MNSEQIREQLIFRRKQLNLTKGQLASLAGVHESTIFNYENGKLRNQSKSQLQPTIIEKIADALGLSIELKEKNAKSTDALVQAIAERFGIETKGSDNGSLA